MSSIEYLSKIFPSNRIKIQDDLTSYLQATTGKSVKIHAAVIPEKTSEISELVKGALQNKLKLYPISSGKNWGYSDSMPITDDNIIVDLSHMDKIINYDPELGFITIEPGVTQKQLAKFLKINGDKHIVAVTGSSPSTSIIGNYLERGFGISSYMDHASAVTDLEAVLPDGHIYKSQLALLGCDKINNLYKHGIGPQTDGLFFQSGIGIVTKMTIKLATKPETSTIFFIESDQQGLTSVIKSLREFREAWPVSNLTFKIFDQLYVLAASGMPYPEEYLYKNAALPKELINQLAQDTKTPKYTITVTLSGPKPLIHCISKALKKQLAAHTSKVIAINELKYVIAQKLKRFMPKYLQQKMTALFYLWNFTQGIPSENALQFAYWRIGGLETLTASTNPAKDDCGIIWYAPIIPFQAEAISELKDMIQDICSQYHINSMFNLTNYEGTYMIALAPIFFDKKTQAKQAHACYKNLIETGLKKGIVPYRLASPAIQDVFDGKSLGEIIKKKLDPYSIIAPGRYNTQK